MKRSPHRAHHKAGMPPGTLLHIGEAHTTSTSIAFVDYTATGVESGNISSISQLLPYKSTDSVTWVMIEGLSDVAVIDDLGRYFNIHPLILEDILNTQQRPKLEETEEHLCLITKAMLWDETKKQLHFEQISIIVVGKFVIVLKEKKDELFTPIRERIISSKSLLRSYGPDFLAYILLDTIVDNYFALQDNLDDITDALEEDLLYDPSKQTLIQIQQVKKALIHIRRTVSAMRELLANLLRSESPHISSHTRLYLRDVSDHVLRVSEAMESLRDMISGLLDIYISSVSNKMNEVMKVLTVFSTIFIPLTFLTGIYGMNFDYMPELKWHWAYPLLWLGFVTIPVSLLIYFRRKKWL